ncbi:hypothetical protein PT974_11478 [Cladobotryum mycophilum]|uniref:Uncharacterized protein n=1 Tax=Cladobotryum mycophilum TaxID=491253 RepID=A0ABR0S6P4_9HYPO
MRRENDDWLTCGRARDAVTCMLAATDTPSQRAQTTGASTFLSDETLNYTQRNGALNRECSTIADKESSRRPYQEYRAL